MRVLEHFCAGADLSWFEETQAAVTKKWMNLAWQHLRIGRSLKESPRDWRSLVSRSYYAVYNASKAVRFFVDGSVRLDGEDHKKVGDLPDDFPSRAKWSNFCVELRRDRNLADYEPWEKKQLSLTYRAKDCLQLTEEFLLEVKKYLRNMSIAI